MHLDSYLVGVLTILIILVVETFLMTYDNSTVLKKTLDLLLEAKKDRQTKK